MAAGPHVLVFGSADNGSEGNNVAATLTSLGYAVDREPEIPSSLAGYSSVWYIEAYKGLTPEAEEELEHYVEGGGSLYLTGERPCCEALNQSDEAILHAVLMNKSVNVGGLGDIAGPFTFNPDVENSVASTPNTLVNFVPNSPGGMAGIGGVSAPNVFASNGTTPVGAIFNEGDMADGRGRIAILMDIDWLLSSERTPIIENIQNFLEHGTGCSNGGPENDPGFVWPGGPANCTALTTPATVSWTAESPAHGPVTFTETATEAEASCSQASIGNVGVLTCTLSNASTTGRFEVTAHDQIGSVTRRYRLLPKNDPRNVPPGYSLDSNWWEWPDRDGDGIPDYWEEHGVWVNGQFLDLPALGANPDHKDLFLHYDSQEGYELDPQVLSDMQEAFANSSIRNPDGTTGVTLHIERGASIPQTIVGEFGQDLTADGKLTQSDIQRVTTYSGFAQGPEIGGGGVPQIFHWMLNREPIEFCSGKTGQSQLPGHFGFTAETKQCLEGAWGRSLSTSAADFSLAANATHELGHQLGLHHHGAADLPNPDNSYKSVMTYAYSQFGVPKEFLGVTLGHRIDYSRTNTVNLDWKMGNGPGNLTFVLGQWGELPNFYSDSANEVIDAAQPNSVEPNLPEVTRDASAAAVEEFSSVLEPEWRPDVPVLVDAQAEVAVGSSTDVPLHASDPYGTPLNYEIVGGSTLGSAAPSSDGIAYQAPSIAGSTDTIVVRATNGTFSSEPATLTIHVIGSGTSSTGPGPGSAPQAGVAVFKAHLASANVRLAKRRDRHGRVGLSGGFAVGQRAMIEVRRYAPTCHPVHGHRRCGQSVVGRTRRSIVLKVEQTLKARGNVAVSVFVAPFQRAGVAYAATAVTRRY
jgi:hypothetical protein